MMLRGRYYPINQSHAYGSPDDKSVVELSWKEGNRCGEAATTMEREQHQGKLHTVLYDE